MGKQLRRKYSSMPFENNNPGCMSGVFHILDFHQWHNVKKMLPHRRHGGGRHPRGLKSSKMDQKIPGTVESPELTDAEVDNIFVDEKMTGASPTNKKSSKARMKALIAEDMSKEDDLKCQISAFSANSQLLRTDSIHYLEPSDHDFFDERNADGKSEGIDPCQDNANISATSTYPLMPKPPEAEGSVSCNKQHEMCGTMNSMNYGGLNLIDELRMQLTKKHALLQDKLDKAKEAFLKQKPMDGKDLIREASFHQSKEFLDALEIFNINKELFLQILQDPDSALANQLQNLQISDARIKLTKSGSFPVACLSGRDNVRPSILMHKQKEIGFFGKQEGKLQAGNSPRKLTIIKPSDDFNAQPLTSLVDESEQGKPEIAEHGTGLDSSLGSPHELKNGGENRVNRFKDIKQRIKHAIKGSRKEHQRISMDAILHRIPYGRRFSTEVKESVTDRDGKDSPRSSFESDGSMFAVSKGGLHRIRRAASLNESLDRYSQLIEFSFSREAKRHLSDRVKLTNEDGGLPGGRPRKALGRILSLPELDSNFSLQSGVSRDALYPGTLTRIHVDTTTANVESCSSDEQRPVGLPISTENGTELEATVDSESQQNLVEENENCPIGGNQEGLLFDTDNDGNTEVHGPSDNLDNQTMGENSCFSHHEQEIGPAKNACIKQAQPSPISVLDSHFEDDLISPAKVFTAEGSELIPRSIDFNELDSKMILQDQSGMDSPCENGSRTDFENVQNLSKHFDSDLPHVQVDRKDESDFNYVRDVLKLSGFCGNEYLGTWQLPDQPVDPSLFEEVECRSPRDYSGQEAGGSCDHQLLFDLINEVLLDIYERSFTYWPRPLSFNHHIRPKPVGYHLLEEVWANISWYLRSQPGLDQSLDCVMARDLAKADGWMNLQFETECVGLELEEWILDELLEHVTCELAVV